MRCKLALLLFVSAGCPSEPEEGGNEATESSTGTSSTGMSGSSASTSTTTASTTETPTSSSESGSSDSGSSTMVAEGSSSSGSSDIECEWYEEADGEREWGRCSPGLAWQDAEDYCVGEGGHLVSMNSAQDGVFAINVLSGVAEAWIGLNDIDTERMYVWTDGNPYEHMNWDDAQPDNPEHRCVGIGGNARWFDYACDEHRVFVCAREL
jgi:hypothetical protein